MPTRERALHLALVAATIGLSTGGAACSSLSLVQGGAAYAPGDPGQSAGTVEGTTGAGASYEHGGVGPALGARAKAGPEVGEAALDLSVFFLAGPRWVHRQTFRGELVDPGTPEPSVFAFGTAGVAVVEGGVVRGHHTLSAGSPSARVGVFLRLPHGSAWGLAISAAGAYELRTNGAPDAAYLQLSIGLAKATYGRQGFVLGAD